MSFVGDMKGRASTAVDVALRNLGFGDSESKLAADAKAYWTGTDDEGWLDNTHIHTGPVMGKDGAWERVGREHLALFDQMSWPDGWIGQDGFNRIVEWGVGGGSNAIAFAPLGKEFVGVDISERIVNEAAYQVAQRTETPFLPVVIDLENPESAEPEIGSVDLFLCLYVLELVPSPAYGIRVMEIAHRLLTENGLAFVQIKYDTGKWNTRSRGRRYRGSVAASMTTYPIHEFWELMSGIGFEPLNIHLIPQNELDERYAYFVLRKPAQVK